MFSLDERMKSLGWRDFPFRIDVMPEVFAAKNRILDPIMVQLRTGNIIIIEGGRGTGKTHVLRWLNRFLETREDMVPLLISEPLTTHILSTALTNLIMRSSNLRFKTPPMLIDQLVMNVQKFHKQRQQRIILLLDEGEDLALLEGDKDSVENEKRKTVRWLRVLSDLPAIVIYIAGLTGFRRALTSLFQPFSERITFNLSLEQVGQYGPEVLSEKEMETLIQKRIEFYGGRGIAPFTKEAIELIHVHTRGYPRATLRFCENIITYAFQEDTPAGDRISADFVHHVIQQYPSPPPESALIPLPSDLSRFIESEAEFEGDEWFEEFDEVTAIQRDILSFIREKGKATSSIIAEEFSIAKGTASNELKKLFDRQRLKRRRIRGYQGFEYLPS